MFGDIIRIDGNFVDVVNIDNEAHSELMNYYVVFEEKLRKVVGEIVEINKEFFRILLVGEIIDGDFFQGVVKKPLGMIPITLMNLSLLELIIGKSSLTKDSLVIGSSLIYKNFNISIPINSFFANHSAIIGNTGSGKSCGVARLLQNLFVRNPFKPVNSHIVLFDAYGEYSNTFDDMNNIGLGFKKLTTKVMKSDEELMKIPPYFLDVDDLAVLLSVSDADQIPVLEKTLKLVYIFTSTDEKVKDYKNDIIAKCLLDILTSGKSGSVMRDQIIAVLSHYNTESLNLESIISQPGYNRSLKQCLMIDDQGKMNAILVVTEFLQKFVRVSLDSIETNQNQVYSLNDIYYALEFALISEGSINSDIAYKQNNILKSRLQAIINSENSKIFDYDKYISKSEFISNFFTINDRKAQLINVNLSYVDDRFAKIITKLYSKLFFTYTTKLESRGSFSVNIILEEAHRYVQNDNDTFVLGYNIFDRITKEGRKYGTILTFITQRPSELSSTALSQCSNYIVFRIFHPRDFEIVKSISTNVSLESLEKLKTLSPGVAMLFGTGFKVPVLSKLELSNPCPESTSLNLEDIWF